MRLDSIKNSSKYRTKFTIYEPKDFCQKESTPKINEKEEINLNMDDYTIFSQKGIFEQDILRMKYPLTPPPEKDDRKIANTTDLPVISVCTSARCNSSSMTSELTPNNSSPTYEASDRDRIKYQFMLHKSCISDEAKAISFQKTKLEKRKVLDRMNNFNMEKLCTTDETKRIMLNEAKSMIFLPTEREFLCRTCGKFYKSYNCLTKHEWEHTEHWKSVYSLPLTKHQMVQMLEAAQILLGLNTL